MPRSVDIGDQKKAMETTSGSTKASFPGALPFRARYPISTFDQGTMAPMSHHVARRIRFQNAACLRCESRTAKFARLVAAKWRKLPCPNKKGAIMS
jgi:hypothetical protein